MASHPSPQDPASTSGVVMTGARRAGLATAAVTMGLLLAGGILEAGTRVLFPPESIAFSGARPAREDEPGLMVETLTGPRLRPNTSVQVVFNNQKEVVLETNELGFRSPPLGPRKPGELRILVVGDSITFGEFVAAEDTFCGRLEKLLQPDFPGVRVINAGVTGLDLLSEVNVLAELGFAAQPDLVIVASYLNDWISMEHLKPLRGVLGRSAFAVKVHETMERSRIQAGLARHVEDLAATKPLPVRWSMDGPWLQDHAEFEKIRASASFDWGHAWNTEAWERTRPDYQRARELAADHGVPLAVVLFPVMFQVAAAWEDRKPQDLFIQQMQDLQVPHLDLLPGLRAEARSNPGLYYDHCHLTEDGHAAAARVMHPFVRDLLKRPAP